MTRVLLAEDDPAISEPLARALRREGYDVDVRGTALPRSTPPAETPTWSSSTSACRTWTASRWAARIRAEGRTVPVLILTARADEVDTVVGLDAGADDYVTKPFRLAELLARVRALLRRSPADAARRATSCAHRPRGPRARGSRSEELQLTAKEFDLLRVLVREQGKVVTREQLMREVWETAWFGSTKTLDMHISVLRRKLGDDADPAALHRHGPGRRLPVRAAATGTDPMRRQLIRSTVLAVGRSAVAHHRRARLRRRSGVVHAPATRRRCERLGRRAASPCDARPCSLVGCRSPGRCWRSPPACSSPPRQARQLSPPDDRARRSRGAARCRRVADRSRSDSGIAELDRVSEVLSRSAQRLTKSLAAERDFAADASHQLRTPLTALLMRLEEIAATDDLDVVQEEANIAIAQVERLTRVVDDLMAAHPPGRRRAAGDRLARLGDRALQREWQPAFEQARRSVRVHGERGLVVHATPVALSQVLSTLLENSLAHGRGTVDVHARRSGPSVVVEVSDQGDGVPSTIAPHIFERSVTSAAAPASASPSPATSPSPTAAGSSSSRRSRRSSRCSCRSPTRARSSARPA